MTEKPYYEFSDFLKTYFPCKVQKISINAGFTCPNRDGTKGRGGCTYCNNQTFNPAYCHTGKSVSAQMEEGIRFFARKYPNMKYIAYFQAYTNTYAPLDTLLANYEEALAFPGVVGLIIGTRPDCMPNELLDYLATRAKTTFILIEYGIESTSDRTLRHINRGHTYGAAVDTILRTHQKGILTGAHLILGLPNEDRSQILHHAELISALPLNTLKLHQLQIIRHTAMEQEFIQHPERFRFYTPQEYIELVIDFMEHLRPGIALDRFVSQSPEELLIVPRWGLKNFEFTTLLNKRLAARQTKQGVLYKGPPNFLILT